MRFIITYFLICFGSKIFAQNCESYKWKGNYKKYEACKKQKEAYQFYQFTKEYQELLDEVIQIDSTYDDAYWAKSIAYLKSGDFLSWKPLIDKAVELNPKMHLGYRGWCRYQFFRDYKGAIRDIEEYEKIIKGDIGYCQNGDYHLLIAKAICYKAIGKKDEAIKIIEDYLKNNNEESDLFNYYHLGVLYFEKGEYQQALKNFKKQEESNKLADNKYYIAMCNKHLNNIKEYKEKIIQAEEMAKEGFFMQDPYTHHYDKVYRSQIIEELNRSKKI
ncbi:hypothetical protein P8625_04480 [Tenacibaculum tangerinum]|uniref:Tetratricopeptide repeat protein n=1 Tax=Tenacibaculum tangerinum TaxID=3038772 RepID=A0ABY8L8G6_9FLAO|nr:hypothetical protein [Tenacibaculum tangerinum]WGH76424.1 hypothetical protein P8625_04480 [Tenacibaculum tangerinum]